MVSKRVLAVFLMLLLLALYLYFGIISPIASKPSIGKPTLAEGEEINANHINWIINEIGGYKLHSSLSGEPPQIGVTADGKPFLVTVKDGKVTTTGGKASNPDIDITADRDTIAKILEAEDMNSEIKKLYEEGSFSVRIIKDEATLALKGYKSIYDELQG